MKDMWEERYAADEYAYGEEPNAFFKACLDPAFETASSISPASPSQPNCQG